MTCAPRPHSTPPPLRLASAIAAMIALRSAAARMFGSESMKEAMLAVASHGLPKSAACALLARDANG